MYDNVFCLKVKEVRKKKIFEFVRRKRIRFHCFGSPTIFNSFKVVLDENRVALTDLTIWRHLLRCWNLRVLHMHRFFRCFFPFACSRCNRNRNEQNVRCPPSTGQKTLFFQFPFFYISNDHMLYKFFKQVIIWPRRYCFSLTWGSMIQSL